MSCEGSAQGALLGSFNYGDTYDQCTDLAVRAGCTTFMFSSSYPVWGCRCCDDPSAAAAHALWSLYTVQCATSAPISVHGDPMFKHNGTGTHFWIKEDVLTPLLLWRTADGLVMELSARTFNRPETGNQWIKQVVVAQNGTTVLDVSATTDDRQMRVKRPARAGKDVNIQVGEDNLVDIEANGVRFVLKPAQATKFYGHDTRHKYEHLDMQFPDGISAAAKPTGIFAQLAGVQPMLAATKELLVEPRLEVKQRKRMGERISRLAERESQLKKQLRRVAAKNPKAAKNTKPAKALNERQLQRLANSELKPAKKPHVMGRPAKQMRTLHASRDVW